MDLSLPIQTTLAQSSLTLAYTWNPMLTNLLVGVFLIISVAMILLVLIQRPQGGGLSGAFGAGGGGGAGQTAFGTKTGDVLTMATITIFVLFLITAIILNFGTRPQAPASSTPTITNPAQQGEGSVGEPVEEGADNAAAEDTSEGDITDPAQAVEDTMNTTPGLESGEAPTGDTPATGEEPATDQPTSDEPATGSDS